MQFKSYQLNRLMIGKLFGLVYGILAFACATYFTPEFSLTFKWGLLIWYAILGHVVANTINAKDYVEQEFKISIPWCIPCLLVGSVFGLALAMIAERKMHIMLLAITSDLLNSPYWLIIDSAGAALIIGYVLKVLCKKKINV